MKKINFISLSLIAFFLISCGTTATLIPTVQSKIVDIENTSKLDLFVRANNWMVHTFNDAESVVQFSDKESGVITGKYLMQSIIRGTAVQNENVFAIIKIQVKDNAAKITITPETYQNNWNGLAGGVSYPLEKATSDINILIDSFENTIKIDTEAW